MPTLGSTFITCMTSYLCHFFQVLPRRCEWKNTDQFLATWTLEHLIILKYITPQSHVVFVGTKYIDPES